MTNSVLGLDSFFILQLILSVFNSLKFELLNLLILNISITER